MWTYEPFVGTNSGDFDEKRTVSLATTAYWELHGNKKDTDVKVGQIPHAPGRRRQVVPRRRADLNWARRTTRSGKLTEESVSPRSNRPAELPIGVDAPGHTRSSGWGRT